MKYQQVAEELRAIPNRKTKDIDAYNRALIRKKEDVSDLASHVLSDQLVHRTYFQVSLKQLRTIEEQYAFIEQNEDLLQDWWHVDQLTHFMKGPFEYTLALRKARKYIRSKKPFVRRWGYVLLMRGPQTETEHTRELLQLMKNDSEYYVQMAEAWLICDLAVYNPKEVYEWMRSSTISYAILGKAIQKICDSYRVSNEWKEKFKAIRPRLRDNGE